MVQLRLWLGARFDLDPDDEGDIMRHGKQKDTFNCGLTTANTIAHRIFKTPLWTPDRAVLERVQWFLHIFRVMSPAENPIFTPTDTHMMDIHPQAEKLLAEDLNMDDGNQLANEDESLSRIPAEVLGVSPPQSQRSYQARANDNPTANEEILALKIAVGTPEPSKSQPRHSHLQVPHMDDSQPAKEDDNSQDMYVDTPALLTPKYLRFRSQIPVIPLNLKCKMWDELSRTGLYEHLEACEARQTLSNQLLNEITSTKDDLADHLFGVNDVLKEFHLRIKVLEAGDDLLAKLKREWMGARSEVQQEVDRHLEAELRRSELQRKMKALEEERDKAWSRAQYLREVLQEFRAAQSEAQQLDHQDQGLEANLEMSQLRRMVKSLTEEKDQALEEGHQLRGLIQESRSPKLFEWGAPSDLWPVQDHGRAEEVSDRHRYSSLGARQSTQSENLRYITWLREPLAARKNRRENLEREVIVLKSELGEFSFLLVLALQSYSELREGLFILSSAVGIWGVCAESPDDSIRTRMRRGFRQS